MNIRLTIFFLVGLCVAVVAISCSKPSGPSATAPAPQSSAVSQPSPPPIFGPEVTKATQITQTDLTTTTPLIPTDLYRPADNVIDHAQAAKFAWLEFIALVSPNASPSPSPIRGQPGGSFSSVNGGAGSTYPLVWETYQHRSELFPAAANGVSPPQPWNQTPTYVYNPQPSVPSGVNYTLFNNLDEASQIFQNNLFFPNPANPSNAFEVLFEAKAGQLENQYVANNYPLPKQATLYDGAIELKAAWRPVASIDPSQLYRYHVATVITYGGTIDNPVVQNQQYALIALHIIHKTKNYPSFIFATFEQVDQYVNQVTNKPTGVYYQTLYPGPEPPPPTPFPTPNNYQVGSYFFATDPNGFSAPGTTPTASSFTATINPIRVFDVNNPMAWPNGQQYTPPSGTGFYPAPLKSTAGQKITVTLPPTSNPDVASVNAQVKSLISSLNLGNDFVWQYYQLTGVQAIPTSDETTKDYYLANIVVESSQAGIQLFRGGLSPNPSFEPVPNIRNKLNVTDKASGNKFSMGGCMGCHGAAQGEGGDFSFLLSTGQSGFMVDTVQDNTLEEAIRNAKARRALIQRTWRY